MARAVIWSPAADRDLSSIADFIARDSPHYASLFVRSAHEAANSLSELSERGSILEELGDTNVRQLLVDSYRLIYRVQEERVVILGLIHASRDLLALWRREGRGP